MTVNRALRELSDEQIAEHLLRDNLHGIDIDGRAVQVAAAVLVDAGYTLKRVVRLALVSGSGELTPLPGVGEDDHDLVRRGDVVPDRSQWSQRNGYVLIEPEPTGGQSVQLDLLQYLPWVDDAADDWFTESAWEAIAKGAAARVAGDLGEQVRPVRWREDFIALALALHGDDVDQREAGAADGVRPPRPVLGWARGSG
jgi:hypothetical protein